MFYEKSIKIMAMIKAAKTILLNAHRSPDLDSIGASTAMMKVLRRLGKKVDIVCPTDVPSDFLFMEGAEEIRTIDFSTFDFKPYDLFIILDSGSYDIVTGKKEISLPDIPTVVIDHHRSNKFTDVKLKLVEEEASATCEMIYKLLTEWKINIDQEMATALFSGIAGDTVFFRYTQNTRETYKIIGRLVELGADKDLLVESMFNNYDFDSIRLVGEFLKKMKKEKNFVWSAIDLETFRKYGKPKGIRELSADLFFQSVKGAGFGLAILEQEKNKLFVSFRSIKDTDVSKIAKSLGGGGHRNAAGCTVSGEFTLTVNNIIDKVRKLI